MATKKKELLEQENTAPETTVTVENAPPLMKRRLIWRHPLMAAI